MMFRELFCSTVILAAFAMRAEGATPSGIDLARDCRADGAIEKARCTAFVGGFISGSQVNFDGNFFNEWRYGESRWCFDESVDDAALVAAFNGFAAAHTKELHFPAATFFGKAMAATFPCR
jgi:hypothetical protein